MQCLQLLLEPIRWVEGETLWSRMLQAGWWRGFIWQEALPQRLVLCQLFSQRTLLHRIISLTWSAKQPLSSSPSKLLLAASTPPRPFLLQRPSQEGRPRTVCFVFPHLSHSSFFQCFPEEALYIHRGHLILHWRELKTNTTKHLLCGWFEVALGSHFQSDGFISIHFTSDCTTFWSKPLFYVSALRI